MLDPDQVLAYAQADFEGPHSNFITLFSEKNKGDEPEGLVLDMGCGPGDITFRFASRFAKARIHAVDGSLEMIKYANNQLSLKPDIKDNIMFIISTLQDYKPLDKYDCVISNSLLHHMADPAIFWENLIRLSGPQTKVFVMDLLRPRGMEEAMILTNKYAGDEPDVLKKDFYNSLLAAFEVGEVENQINKAGLDLKVEQVSDRHLITYGSV